MEQVLTELQKRTLANLETRLDRIAVLPSVISKLAALDLSSADASDQIIALVRSDPPLALRLMRAANSAATGAGNVVTIPNAIVRVGAVTLANIILALSVVEVFVPRTRAQRNLWIHSIQTALTARRIAGLRSGIGLEPEECFLAGLLHDIGRFMIFEHTPEEMAQLDESEVADPLDLVAAELRVCGFDHALLGHEVCRRWHLPESLCEMVRSHHFYGKARNSVPPEVSTLVQVVQEADCLSFGMLRTHGALLFQSDSDCSGFVDGCLHALSHSERIVPAAGLSEELKGIDREAHIAAAAVNIAYSGTAADSQDR